MRSSPRPGSRLRRAVASIDMLSPYPQLVAAGFRRHATHRQAALTGLPGVVGVTVEAQGLRQRLESTGATTAAALIAEVARRVELRDVGVDEPSIEDLARTLHAS